MCKKRCSEHSPRFPLIDLPLSGTPIISQQPNSTRMARRSPRGQTSGHLPLTHCRGEERRGEEGWAGGGRGGALAGRRCSGRGQPWRDAKETKRKFELAWTFCKRVQEELSWRSQVQIRHQSSFDFFFFSLLPDSFLWHSPSVSVIRCQIPLSSV